MKKVDMLVLTHHMYTMAGEGVGYCEDFAVAIDKERSSLLHRELILKASIRLRKSLMHPIIWCCPV